MNKLLCAFLGLLALLPTAHGQEKNFPDRAVKIIVPFTAGSGSDTSARFFGEELAAIFGQPFVVENRPGASGVLAVMAVKNAPPDGYTILLASNSPIAVNPIVIKGLPYDPTKDLRPISGLTRGMSGLIVATNSSIKTIADLVAASKAKPLNAGTYSAGYNLALEWFSSLAGAKVMNVPYKGGAQVFTDVMGNQLDFGVADMGGVAPLLKAGKMRALAVTGKTRHPDFPDVPTIQESGYPDYVFYTWTSFYVRSDTPDDITSKLAAAMQRALASPAARNFVAKAGGGELMPYAPDAMLNFQLTEMERFRRIADAAGIVAQ
jgi:tripartite-type tricarboxylate transporter receptor subunit TctC